jgi:hypothetical protein
MHVSVGNMVLPPEKMRNGKPWEFPYAHAVQRCQARKVPVRNTRIGSPTHSGVAGGWAGRHLRRMT